jgi:adenine/guanine/hypoxanthine permease
MITYREALGAVFLEGWIFLLLSILGLRQWLARIMPHSLILALSAGIGLFISLLGLSSSGLDIVGGSTTDLLALGGCEPQDYVDNLPGFCNSKVLRDPTVWFGTFMGGFLTVLLMMYRVKGALLIGIILTSVISWPRGTAITFFPYTEAGNVAFDYFKKVVTFHPLEQVGGALDVSKLIFPLPFHDKFMTMAWAATVS